MQRFSTLLADDVKTVLRANFDKIKTQMSDFNHRDEVVKSYNFCLVDEDAPFQIENLISVLAPIRNPFCINFAVVYMLREDSEIRYYYLSMEDSCLLETVFRVNEERDIETFREEFERGHW